MLGGRYQLGEVLGEGGAATVYRAWDSLEGRSCAVKIVRVEGGDRDRLLCQLRQESAALRRLSHPNIVRLLGTGEEESGPWIAMELVEGGSLADRVAKDGPVSARRGLQLVLQLLRGLEAVHAAGILHRDIKPDNLLLQEDGTCKLADFGIALLDDQSPTTSAGLAIGSLPFMAPEQRANSRTIDARADLYSAGATLYYLVTGSTPIDLDLSPPTSPRFAGLPEGLVALIRRGTHADPVQRFQSAAEMAVAVTACLSLAPDEVYGQSLPPVDPSPDGGRVITAEVPTAAGDLEALEAELQREWREKKDRDVRHRTQRTARWTVGIAITLLGVLVAMAGRYSLESWVAREEARQAALSTPITGTWRGTVGSQEAVLSLQGPVSFLSGSFRWTSGSEVRQDAVRGVFERGLLILKTESANGEKGQYRALMAVSGRLDGDYMSVTNTIPFHLVQVRESGP